MATCYVDTSASYEHRFWHLRYKEINLGLTSSAKANSYISKMMCSLSLVPDDMLNGNVTTDGSSLFIGFNKLK